ncbi:MAG: AmmeMemoRadiSam system protein B [Candidatus Margulisiibacteriota bacterium]|nr:AmmeMemoRadiSam system protein B [Candidatus Margulisiibacteriota bacterium]
MIGRQEKLWVRDLRLGFAIFFFVLYWLFASQADAFFADVRKPAVADMFYPKDKQALSKQIDYCLENVQYRRLKGRLIAMIVPHAGLMYSGQIAAYGYKELEGEKYKRVILMGSSHYQSFDGISVAEYDYYKTPLGRIKVDREFARQLVESSPKIGFLPEAHKKEHSLEVQLPFLQKVLKKGYKIVPIIFGNPSLLNCQVLAMSLAKYADDETLIICSTDWSHYHDYDTAVRMDKKGIRAVLNNDVEGFINLIGRRSSEACAAPAVITTMLLAPTLGANKTVLLQYANSGDVSGDKSKVVGYASIAYLYESAPLLKSDKRELLRIARRTLSNYITKNEVPEVKIDGPLTDRRGVFVTLNKNGKLRGCIGYIQPRKPLAEAVQEMVIAAAVRDARFPEVTKSELRDINIEISALSRLERVYDVDEIETGRDGLYIIKGDHSGLLLPQVAIDQGWGREEFLENVCYKARLAKDSWKEKNAVLYRFSAEVFHE